MEEERFPIPKSELRTTPLWLRLTIFIVFLVAFLASLPSLFAYFIALAMGLTS